MKPHYSWIVWLSLFVQVVVFIFNVCNATSPRMIEPYRTRARWLVYAMAANTLVFVVVMVNLD